MIAPSTPQDEQARLSELRSLALLDTEPEARFDRVTRLAQRLFDVPIALVSFVDDDRQWFKSHMGLDATETPRDISFCGHAILEDRITEVPDARLDVRFSDNPLVTGDPGIRFYAGCPIAGPSGHKLGTLCIIDRHPRELSDEDQASLRDIPGMVEREVAALHLAAVDKLTGLSNRRGFDSLASMVIAVCGRQGRGATLICFDLDGFKAINDVHGHEGGDEALQAFAKLLESTFRQADVVARLGGDEFAVLLSATEDPGEALARFEANLAVLNAHVSRTVPIRTSYGIAEYHTGNSIDDLIARADKAMYLNKTSKAGE